MDGVIRIYEDTASNSDPAIEIGFTVGKHRMMTRKKYFLEVESVSRCVQS